MDSIGRRTEALQSALAEIRQRLIDRMRGLSAQGDALAAQADTADSAALGRIHNQLDALADEFKRISAIFLPLTKEDVLLGQYRRNLTRWRAAADSEYRDAMKTLGVRVGVLLILLSIVFALAELSRRAVLRYVQDARRRHQLLLLQKIAFWSLVAVIVGLATASELKSAATFAGLITAGLALAMQSVLVSIVGYFLLIGKYGIRVGDRVQIGDVDGEVIEVGIVRMHLMEFAGRGSTRPTGRVVAFPNSVVFQVSTGLFRQIPGVNLDWHDITLGVPAGVDYATLKEKLERGRDRCAQGLSRRDPAADRGNQAHHRVEFGRRRSADGTAEFLRQGRRGARSLPGAFASCRRNRRAGVAGAVAGDLGIDARGAGRSGEP